MSKISFRRQRTTTLLQRGLRSLRTRGLRGTLARLRAEARPALPSAALAVPEDAPFTPFDLPCPDTPRVSVVIPVYNHLQHSLTCLRSIAAQPSRISAEIIVVDDCSSDDSASVLPQIHGLRYLRNAQNLGFIGACNAGAAAARGDYLVFLNNDTAVQPGWLDALIDTFEQHPEAGLVGAKLVYPDGRLQEAGGIVFADGSGWNYGRFGDPAAPEYNYLREVDYCSGAAIALPAALFREFGGFDPHYAPAYYEDTDLAMKVRTRGLKVLYQPKSAVVHFEGISSGTDTNSGIKAYQVVNQGKFLERWREALASHPAPGTPIEQARQHRDRRHVLIIDATTPAPDQDSGSLRMVNLMRVLRSEGCAVTFFADNRAFIERYSADLQQLGVEVLWHPWLSDVPGWFARHGERFDLVILSRHYIAVQYVDLVRAHAPQAVLAFDTVDLHYLREQREAALTGREDLRRQAAQTRERELDLIRRSDVTLVVSPVEQALLAREAPAARVEILSNVHEVHGRRRAFAERHDIVFMGGYQHPPNVDAVTWFADRVLPLIHAEAPELVFHIVGSKAPDEVRALGERPGIMFHGFVPDIAPFMDDCRIAVAPLRYGAGVKGKVNMSMSFGQPVVATPIAIEGMHAEPGRDVLVAETPEDFARKVLAAYRDPELWLQLSEGGLANVEAHFGFESARQAVHGLFKH
ncbi:MAG: glycosyltransferase [Aquimonas sp.]|nr:glycosyltransferase [Aquimonas sp.]